MKWLISIKWRISPDFNIGMLLVHGRIEGIDPFYLGVTAGSVQSDDSTEVS